MPEHSERRWAVWAEPNWPNLAEPRWWPAKVDGILGTDPLVGSRAFADAQALQLEEDPDLVWHWRFRPRPYPSSDLCCAMGARLRPVCALDAGHMGDHREGELQWPLVKTAIERMIDDSIATDATEQLQFVADYLQQHPPSGPQNGQILQLLRNIISYLTKVKDSPQGLRAPFRPAISDG
jgi:hypothetical protein